MSMKHTYYLVYMKHVDGALVGSIWRRDGNQSSMNVACKERDHFDADL